MGPLLFLAGNLADDGQFGNGPSAPILAVIKVQMELAGRRRRSRMAGRSRARLAASGTGIEPAGDAPNNSRLPPEMEPDSEGMPGKP